MAEQKKSVVVVDDSPVVRTLLKHIIESTQEFTVTGQASNGVEAVALVKQLRPSVVTMDVQMPKMDGPSAIRQIMKEFPTPILLCSVTAHEGAPVVLDALQGGAFDFVTKPKSVLSDTSDFGPVLLEKLRAALTANRNSLAGTESELEPEAEPERQAVVALAEGRAEIVVFGASTGGPKALLSILPGLPAGFPAAVIVALQGMPAPILKLIADQLSKACPLPVQLGAADDMLVRGRITLLPADHHAMVVHGAQPEPRLKLLDKHLSSELTPALNGLFSSVAVACPGRCIGVLLTGTGKDGAIGMKRIKMSGGVTIAEDKQTAVVYDKPGAAVALDVVDLILPSYKVSEGILRVLAPKEAAREGGSS